MSGDMTRSRKTLNSTSRSRKGQTKANIGKGNGSSSIEDEAFSPLTVHFNAILKHVADPSVRFFSTPSKALKSECGYGHCRADINGFVAKTTAPQRAGQTGTAAEKEKAAEVQEVQELEDMMEVEEEWEEATEDEERRERYDECDVVMTGEFKTGKLAADQGDTRAAGLDFTYLLHGYQPGYTPEDAF